LLTIEHPAENWVRFAKTVRENATGSHRLLWRLSKTHGWSAPFSSINSEVFSNQTIEAA